MSRIGALLAGVALLAVAAPILTLATGGSGAGLPPLREVAPITPQSPPELASVLDRPLFADGGGSAPVVRGGGPELVGIVGRLGGDAVAMVRGQSGATKTIAIGQAIDGWRLESIARDAALFTRGRERRRVELPSGGDSADQPN